MKKWLAVANTDALNLANFRIPSQSLAAAIENGIDEATAAGIPFGMVSLISHDLHKPIGWSVPLGVHFCGTLGRLVMEWKVAETESEQASVGAAHRKKLNVRVSEAIKLGGAQLKARIGAFADDAAIEPIGESISAQRKGIAADLYPDLFQESSTLVDKDGLVSLPELLARFQLLAPGVFKGKKTDLLLFAHPYFRRSLSQLNTLNEPLLEELVQLLKKYSGLDIKIKLDGDRIGASDGYATIELEHWWGPKFQDDISAIPGGVTRHSANAGTRLYCGINQTEFWWKFAESRPDGNRVRTFEVEELPQLDNPSFGVSTEYYGARYLHAEYTEDERLITHFDGAIREYSDTDYLERIEKSISTAGKHADYTKLFRVDGGIAVGDWKSITCTYFRNNDLVPEYFGADTASKGNRAESNSSQHPMPKLEGMVGYIPSRNLSFPKALTLGTVTDAITIADVIVRPYDFTPPATTAWLKQFPNYDKNVLVSYPDQDVNIPALIFGDGVNSDELEQRFLELATVINSDAYPAGVSCSLVWPYGNYWVALSLLGEPGLVATALRASAKVVRPDIAPSNWIEPWKAIACANHDADVSSNVALRHVSFNCYLHFDHPVDGVLADLTIPPSHPLFTALSKDDGL